VTGLTAQAVRGRCVAFGVLAGLLVLTRLDIGIVVAAVYLATPAMRRPFWVAPLIGSALVLPWLAFSWYHFGSAIPTSFVIKTMQGSFGDETFANGLWVIWREGARLPVALALIPAALGVVTSLCMLTMFLRRRLRAALLPLLGLGLGGAAYFGVYCLLNVPPYHWYYVGSTVPLGITGIFGLALVLHGRRTAGSRLSYPVLTAMVLAVVAVVSFGGRPVPWTHPVLFGNWAMPDEYKAIGAEVGERVGDATVLAPPEIGTVAFVCRCSVVDMFSDPGITLPLIERRTREAGPVVRLLLEANFFRLDRTKQPRPAEYRLVWTQGPVPAGVPAWSTTSPKTGPATVYLERTS
jgi:hypothetical protein